MVDLTRTIYRRIKNDLIKPGYGVSIRTWKGDRGFTLISHDQGFHLKVDGYVHEEVFFSTWKESERYLKKVFKREFPRSNRVSYQCRQVTKS